MRLWHPGEILRGSAVTVRARPLRTFAALAVVLKEGEDVRRIELSPVASEVVWRFVARAAMRFQYVAVDHDGRDLVERGWHEIRVRPDRPPRVRLAEPEGETEVRSGQQVMVQGDAEDDIGLAGLELVVALPGGGLNRRSVAFAPQDKRAEVRETIEVDKLGLRAGEFASVYLEASDSMGGERGRRVASRRLLLRMFSPEIHHGRVMDALAELTLRWTGLLADRLEQDPSRAGIELAAAIANRRELAEAEAVGLQALDYVRKRIGEDVLARASTAANLREIGELLRNRLGEEERSVLRMKGKPNRLRQRRRLATVRRLHARIIATEERAVVLLAGLSAAEHRQAVVQQSRTLEDIEDKLEDKLSKLAGEADEAGAVEAERLLDAVSAQLERMLASLARQMPLAPMEHFNPGGLSESGVQGALHGHRDALARIRELMRKGDYEGALRELKALRAELGGALGELRSRVERETTGAEAALKRLVGRLRGGIAAARKEQADVREAARPASEQQRRRLAEHIERTVRAAMPQIKALLEDARDQVRPRRLGSAQARANRAIGRARAALSTARTALDHGGFDGAMQALAEAAEQFAVALRELSARPGAGVVVRDLLEADRGRIRAAVDRVGRAAAALREALPAPRALLEPGQRRRLGELEARQRGIRQRLQRVRKRLGRDANAHPALQSQVGGRLDHAMAMMKQAEQSMRRGDGVATMEQTAEADAALQKAARMLSEPQRAPHPAAGSGVGFAPPRSDVNIGSGNRSDRRRNYREALLEAMKRKAPAGYRERLRRYYESISR